LTSGRPARCSKGSPVVHRNVIEQIDDFGQQSGAGNPEPGVAHVMCIRRAVTAEVTKEREYVFVHHLEHLGRGEVLEMRPAVVVVRPALFVRPLGEDALLHRLLQALGLLLLKRLEVVEPADEQQIGDLLDYLQRVRDPARRERIRDLVNLPLDVSRKLFFLRFVSRRVLA
jgi:hypothetical protein